MKWLMLGLAMVCCICLLRLLVWLRKLREEVTRLPEPGQALRTATQPLIGVNLKEMMHWPPPLENMPVVVMISSPTCPPCHKEMEELTQNYENIGVPVPFLCIVRSENEDAFLRYAQKYRHFVPLMPAGDEFLIDRLNIQMFPTAFLMDPTGVIRVVDRSPGQLIVQLQQMLASAQAVQESPQIS